MRAKDTVNTTLFPSALLVALMFLPGFASAAPSPEEYEEDQIEIIEGEDRMIYEYRQNGILTMIKIVPKNGLPYYMVPLDGDQHTEGLDHQKKLYPQWVIKEW
jgi:hypothetical protein